MRSCEQAPGYSIWNHGIDVAARYHDLFNLLQGKEYGLEWSLTETEITLMRSIMSQALSPEQAHDYHLFHDCGKPYCLVIDENGRRHFPDHAAVSEEIFLSLYPEEREQARLIYKDMLCWTAKGEDRNAISEDPDGPTLILTAYSELYANADKLFGGFESDSFKIKRKSLLKILKMIANQYGVCRRI